VEIKFGVLAIFFLPVTEIFSRIALELFHLVLEDYGYADFN